MRLSHRNLATAILFSTTLALAAQSAAPAPKKPATAKGSSAASQDLTKIDLSTLLSRANAGDPAAEFEFGRRYFVGLGAAKGGLDPDIEQAILWFKKAAAKGNRDAQWQLGVIYENGLQSTPVDKAQAAVYLGEAASQGTTKATTELAKLQPAQATTVPRTTSPQPTTPQTTTATTPQTAPPQPPAIRNLDIATLTQQANAGDAASQAELGRRYLGTGQGVAQDYAQAFLWFQKAAYQNNLDGEGRLGEMYLFGWGVPKDDVQADAWFQKLADQGNTYGLAMLARQYAEGKGVAKDPVKAFALYRQAADNGDSFSEGKLGSAYQSGTGVAKDIAQAVIWYQKGAAAGDAASQDALGMLYVTGNGVPQDSANGAALILKAANQDNARAEYHMGLLAETGKGVPQNDTDAFNWFTKSAGHQDAHAEYSLGELYANGWGVPQDYSQARTNFRSAALQNYAPAEVALAQCYASGNGCPVDPGRERQLLQQAAGQGNAEAQALLAKFDAQAASQPPSHQGPVTFGELLGIPDKPPPPPSPAPAQKHGFFSGLLSAVDSFATVTSIETNLAHDAVSLSSGGGLGTLVKTAEDLHSAPAQLDAAGHNGDPLANLADIMQKGQSTISVWKEAANNSGSSGGAASGSASASDQAKMAACNSSVQPLKDQCAANPGLASGQVSCYRAAAALCQCYADNFQTNPSRPSWLACAASNNASANSLGSNSATIGP